MKVINEPIKADPVIVMARIRGATGASGESSVMDCVAGDTISALKVVYMIDNKVYLLDNQDDEHINLLAGISLNTATKGNPLKIKRLGEITDNYFNFNIGRVYLGQNGNLTQVEQEEGYHVLLGTATSNNTLLLNIDDPIKL